MPAALAFDMYGTLVDLAAVTDRLEAHDLDAARTAQRWRETGDPFDDVVSVEEVGRFKPAPEV